MRQAPTAAAVYHSDIAPTLKVRHAFVHRMLRSFVRDNLYAPTALELLRYARSTGERPLLDVNGIRPRLTEMFDLGWVEYGPTRECSVSGKRVRTWVPTEPKPPEPPRAPEPATLF